MRPLTLRAPARLVPFLGALAVPALTRAALALVALVGLAACDSEGLPDPYNPVDPAFGGVRTATAPDSLTVAATTPTSVSLVWRDRSSFETGVRVERAEVRPGEDLRFATIAVLPASATAYTDTDLTDTAPHQYRVVALAGGETESLPSEPAAIRYPADTLVFDDYRFQSAGARIGPDSDRMYLFTGEETYPVDLRTGTLLAPLGVTRNQPFVDFLDGGRIAFDISNTFSTFGLQVFDRMGGSTTATYGSSNSSCNALSYRLRVAAASPRAAAFCGDRLYVWDGSAPLPSRSFPVGPVSVFTPGLALSPDGTTGYVYDDRYPDGDQTVRAYDLGSRALLWTYAASSGLLFEFATFSEDGDGLALASGGRLRLLDARTGAIRLTDTVDGIVGVMDLRSDRAVGVYATTDAGRERRVLRIVRTADASLVRTVRGERVLAARLVPGGLVVFEGAASYPNPSSPPQAIRLDFGALWEAVTVDDTEARPAL